MLARALSVALVASAFSVPGCEAIPADPEGTLERVSGGVLRVGMSEHDPWTALEDGERSGVEVRLIEEFAAERAAEVDWHDGGEEFLIGELHRGALDVVVGGLTAKSPWVDQAALTPALRRRDEPGGFAGAARAGREDGGERPARRPGALPARARGRGGRRAGRRATVTTRAEKRAKVLAERIELPPAKTRVLEHAVRLEWLTLAFLTTAVLAMYLALGSSQAMKAAWIEDLLSFLPPIAFLVTNRVRSKEPTRDYPFGFHRSVSVGFLVSAVALLTMGTYLVAESVLGLVSAEHVPIGLVTVFGYTFWAGWLMIAALAYTLVPPVLLGRAKLKPASELHDKVLYADADMNKADWQTAAAGIVGVLGIGLGLWWLDFVAADRHGWLDRRRRMEEPADGAGRPHGLSRVGLRRPDDGASLRGRDPRRRAGRAGGGRRAGAGPRGGARLPRGGVRGAVGGRPRPRRPRTDPGCGPRRRLEAAPRRRRARP